MRTFSLALTLVGAIALATSTGGCSSQPSTRAVTGQLRVDTSTMNRPVVIAQSSDHRVFVAAVTASGRFTLQLPAGVGYRMTLASSTSANGVYSAAARINWPLPSGASRWAIVGGGAAIDLGAVYRRGTRPSGLGTACDSCGGSDGDHQDGGDHGDDGDHGDCHEDDHACGGEHTDVDDDCDHKVGSADKCDHDDAAAEHDKDADDDDHERCTADGGATIGGGGGGGDLGGIK